MLQFKLLITITLKNTIERYKENQKLTDLMFSGGSKLNLLSWHQPSGKSLFLDKSCQISPRKVSSFTLNILYSIITVFQSFLISELLSDVTLSARKLKSFTLFSFSDVSQFEQRSKNTFNDSQPKQWN